MDPDEDCFSDAEGKLGPVPMELRIPAHGFPSRSWKKKNSSKVDEAELDEEDQQLFPGGYGHFDRSNDLEPALRVTSAASSNRRSQPL